MGRRMIELRVEDVMTADVKTVTTDTGLAEAAEEMARLRVHRCCLWSPTTAS